MDKLTTFWMGMMKRLVLLLFCTASAVAACGSTEDTQSASERDDASSVTEAGCIEAPTEAVEYINQGIEEDSVRILGAKAFKSPRRYHDRDVYFISGEISGKGFESGGDIGTWAQVGAMGAYMVMAVKGPASMASTFGTAGAAPIRESSYPGVQESIACAQASPTGAG